MKIPATTTYIQIGKLKTCPLLPILVQLVLEQLLILIVKYMCQKKKNAFQLKDIKNEMWVCKTNDYPMERSSRKIHLVSLVLNFDQAYSFLRQYYQ